MKKFLFILLITFSSAYAETIYENNTEIAGDNAYNTKLKAPLTNLFASTQWDLFLREFEMTLKTKMCCNKNDISTCAIGLRAHMIEPIGYMETTQKPLKFPFADLDLGGDPVKGNSFFSSDDDDDSGRGVAGDAHFIYMPVMNMIFKKRLTFVCFHQGDLLIPYMSEFDPTWKQDAFAIKMIPHMLMMFTPQSLVSGLLDCVAGEVVNGIMGYQKGSSINITNDTMESAFDDEIGAGGQHEGEAAKTIQDNMNRIRDTFYFVDGCNGFTPVGGYVHGEDPIADATLMWHGIMANLHGVSAMSPASFLSKQTDMYFDVASMPTDGPVVSNLDTICRWKDFALPIASQYLLQLAYPVVGSAKEMGSTSANVSTAKNLPQSANSSVFLVWIRRDYAAFAYFCGKDDK
jgi:hypothetical protein